MGEKGAGRKPQKLLSAHKGTMKQMVLHLLSPVKLLYKHVVD